MRECPRPVTTHYGSSDVSARSPADLKFGSLSSNSRPPRRFNVFRCFGPLARGPEFRKVLQGKATPHCLVFESVGPLAGGPESRRPLPMQSRPAIFESSEISARSPAERNIGRLLPCNAKPAPPNKESSACLAHSPADRAVCRILNSRAVTPRWPSGAGPVSEDPPQKRDTLCPRPR